MPKVVDWSDGEMLGTLISKKAWFPIDHMRAEGNEVKCINLIILIEFYRIDDQIIIILILIPSLYLLQSFTSLEEASKTWLRLISLFLNVLYMYFCLPSSLQIVPIIAINLAYRPLDLWIGLCMCILPLLFQFLPFLLPNLHIFFQGLKFPFQTIFSKQHQKLPLSLLYPKVLIL